MKKTLLLITCFHVCILTSVKLYSQAPVFGYDVTYDTATYVPLTSGTVISSGIWTPTTLFIAPIGFNFTVGGTKTINSFFIVGGTDVITDTSGATIFGDFQMEDATLVDRGVISHVPSSPIRYVLSGTPGNYIFKAEIFNAGFGDEFINYHTLNDSINMQIWFYQGSNVVEYRYGPSQISHYTDYYYIGGPEIGFGPNLDTAGNGTLYILKGNSTPNPPYPAVMAVDSFKDTTQGISSYPSTGTVYQFKPRTAYINTIPSLNDASIYPTCARDRITISYFYNGETTYSIININGASVNISGKTNFGTTHVDISNLPSGMYLLEMQNEGGRVVRKFIKM